MKEEFAVWSAQLDDSWNKKKQLVEDPASRLTGGEAESVWSVSNWQINRFNGNDIPSV